MGSLFRPAKARYTVGGPAQRYVLGAQLVSSSYGTSPPTPPVPPELPNLVARCRLQADSTTQLSLQRYQGSTIPISVSGAMADVTIPATAPTVSNAGLLVSTLYYAYATGSPPTLELSTTTHATDATSGVEVKTGDSTRTFLGMVWTDAAGLFQDSVTARNVANWFNRSRHDLLNTFTANRTMSNTASWAEINAEIEVSFLAWADEACEFAITGTVTTNLNGNAEGTGLGVDSTTSPLAVSSFTGNNGVRGPIALEYLARVTEGRHVATVLGRVSGGTGSWETPTSIASGIVATQLVVATRI